MSRFHTSIPIDIEAVKALLPKRATFVHGVSLVDADDHKKLKVVVDWECGELTSGFTFPVDFPVEELRAQKLPKGVSFVTNKPAPKVPTTPPPPVPKTKASAAKVPKTKAPDQK